MRRSISSEIERSFILKRLPQELPNSRGALIKQGYLSIEPDREVHLHSIEERFFLTAMTGEGLSRGELETEITKIQFMGLWPLTTGRRLEKLRFEYREKDYVFLIDIYQDKLDSLMLAQIEFKSVNHSRRFTYPDFIGEEVTDDWRFKEKILAIKGLPHDAISNPSQAGNRKSYKGFGMNSVSLEKPRAKLLKTLSAR